MQLNFDDFYNFVQSVVDQVNGVSYKVSDLVQKGSDYISGLSKEKTKQMQACARNPISVECNPNAADQIQRMQQLMDEVERYKKLLET